MAQPAPSSFRHDHETFLRVPRRDRPAQFAGVRTDAEMNEIGAPVMHFCQPTPDFLPEPQAVLLTGMLSQRALVEGLPEHAFAAAIERDLARDGTIGVGYSNIRFDDEATRFLFWRNLIDPCAREWQNGCGRWDMLDVVRCTWALRPNGIVWPTHQTGEMTGWPLVHLSGMYPVERGCRAVVWPLGRRQTNKNELIVWDLAQDPRELATLDAETVRRRMFTRQDAPASTTRHTWGRGTTLESSEAGLRSSALIPRSTTRTRRGAPRPR